MKPGDIVVLKSGSPRMTVEEVDGSLIHVVWFDQQPDDQWCAPSHETFRVAVLELED